MRLPRRRFSPFFRRLTGIRPQGHPVHPRGLPFLGALGLATGASITMWPADYPCHLGVAVAGRREVAQP